MKLGSLKVYRIYDIGHEIILQTAFEKLKSLGQTSQFSLKKPTKDVLFEDPALVLTLNSVVIGDYSFEVVVKMWSYGALSFCLSTDTQVDGDKDNLINWIKNTAYDPLIDRYCRDQMVGLTQVLGQTLLKPGIWSQSEEYNIFVANPEASSLAFWTDDNFLYQFLSMENMVSLSEAMIQPIKESSLQYTSQDLVVVDWDNAFVYSKDDVEDICDVIELANVQLLELRFFDDLLDKKLSGLYRQVIERKPSIFNSSISLLARDASRLYMETSEVVERIENSFKVVGDIYFARIYRLTLKRLQLPQWQLSVDQKLKNLLDISQMYMGELNNKRSHFMEVVIIILIAIEVVPLIGPYLYQYAQFLIAWINSQF